MLLSGICAHTIVVTSQISKGFGFVDDDLSVATDSLSRSTTVSVLYNTTSFIIFMRTSKLANGTIERVTARGKGKCAER